MTTAIWENEKGVYLRVNVRPKSSEKIFVAEISPEIIVVNLKNPAREGKANSELIKKLAKVLMTSSGNIRLVSGHKSKEKILKVEGLGLDDIEQRLSAVT